MIDFEAHAVRVLEQHGIVPGRPLVVLRRMDNLGADFGEEGVGLFHLLALAHPKADVVQSDGALLEALAGVMRRRGAHAEARPAAHAIVGAGGVHDLLHPQERQQTPVEFARLLEVTGGDEDVRDAVDFHRSSLADCGRVLRPERGVRQRVERERTLASKSQHLILALDLAGAAVAAQEGAGAAMASHLDLLGVLVIAFVAALGGGIARDILIGQAPPRALRDWRYPAVPLVAGIAAFAFSRWVRVIPQEALVTLDAAALGLLAVAGAEKSLDQGLSSLAAILVGGVTGVGGGVLRDMLLDKIPAVLTRDVYASAALAGAAIMIAARRFGVPNTAAALLGAAACFTLRMAAFHFGWQLPRAV